MQGQSLEAIFEIVSHFWNVWTLRRNEPICKPKYLHRNIFWIEFTATINSWTYCSACIAATHSKYIPWAFPLSGLSDAKLSEKTTELTWTNAKKNEYDSKCTTYSLLIRRKNICFPFIYGCRHITLCYAGKRTVFSAEYRNKIIKEWKKEKRKPFFCYTFFCEMGACRIVHKTQSKIVYENLFWLLFFISSVSLQNYHKISFNFIKQIFTAVDFKQDRFFYKCKSQYIFECFTSLLNWRQYWNGSRQKPFFSLLYVFRKFSPPSSSSVVVLLLFTYQQWIQVYWDFLMCTRLKPKHAINQTNKSHVYWSENYKYIVILIFSSRPDI